MTELNATKDAAPDDADTGFLAFLAREGFRLGEGGHPKRSGVTLLLETGVRLVAHLAAPLGRNADLAQRQREGRHRRQRRQRTAERLVTLAVERRFTGHTAHDLYLFGNYRRFWSDWAR